MVGMGDLAGARNMYSGVYFSSDPAAATGPLQIYKVGNFKISKLAIYLRDPSMRRARVPVETASE